VLLSKFDLDVNVLMVTLYRGVICIVIKNTGVSRLTTLLDVYCFFRVRQSGK
jgi:hypothetical protein